jgi:hypothetical protein
LSGDIGYRCVLDSTRGFVGVGSTLFPCKAVKISMTSLDFRIPHHNGIARTYQAPVDTDIHAIPLPEGRDPRIDFVLGLINWFIFLDHIPHNVVSWITLRNYGFSGAADPFMFVSGYAAAILYAKMILERGFIVGATRIFRRVGQLYAAYVVLFVIYIVVIGHVAASYAAPDIINEFNVTSLVDHPVQTLAHGLILQSKVLNLDMLQLYIVLMVFLPPVLWILLRSPALAMLGSIALYCAARQFGWNLRSFPDGSWYFNPFCWQLLFVSGAWLALGGARRILPAFNFPVLHYVGIVYLCFALAMTMAGRFPQFGEAFPSWLVDAFNPNDRISLAPYRVLHFIILAFLVTSAVSKDWGGLRWRIIKPVIKCGQHSLAVFCVGVFLSFAGHFILIISSDSVLMQVFVSVAGIAIMTLVAYTISWSREQDKLLSKATG